MYKRLLALLLAFVMVFALLPVSAFAEGEIMPAEPDASEEPVPTEEPIPTVAPLEPITSLEPADQQDGGNPPAVEGDASGDIVAADVINPLPEDDKPTTGRVTVIFTFDSDSTLSEEEAPGINLYAGGDLMAVMTHETGRSASFEMEPGTYTFQCGGIYSGLNRFIQTSEMVELTVEAGKEYTVNMTGKYVAQGLLKAQLAFAEGSPIQADSGVRIRGIIYKDGESYGGYYYAANNNYYDERRLDCGTYTLEFEPVEVENYKCVVEPVTFTIEPHQECSIAPVVSVVPALAPVKVTVTLSFDADSTLSEEEAPGIELWAGDTRVAELTHENGRSATFEMAPGTYTFQCVEYSSKFNRFIQTSKNGELTVETGKEYSMLMTGKYVAQGILKSQLSFAEDSPLQADSGVRICGSLYKDGSYEVVYYTPANNYYQELQLDCGTYTLEFQPYGVENYKCVYEPVTFTIEAYQECIITNTISFMRIGEPANIEMEFSFPEDCPLENYEEVYIYAGVSSKENDYFEICCLYAGNNFRGTLPVKSGDYNISYLCSAPAGYRISISEDNFIVMPGETYQLSREIPVTVVAAVHFQVLYDEDSVIDAAQAGTVELKIYRYDDGLETTRYLYPEDDYKLSESLYPGRYRFTFTPQDVGTCMHTAGTKSVFATLEVGEEYNIQYSLKYVESATVNLEIFFAEDSAIGAEDITEIEPYLVTNDWRLSTMCLSAETGWKASIAVPAAETEFGLCPPSISGYECTTPKYESMTFEPGETYTIRRTLKYVKTDEEKGRVTVTLQFDENSPISAESLGDITVNFKDSGGAKYTAQMPAGNDRYAEIELYPGNYTVSFEGTAVEGYSTNLELIRKTVCKSGETTELVYTAMYNKLQQEGDNTGPKPLPGVGSGDPGADSPIKPVYPTPSPVVPDPFNPPPITPIYPDDNKRGEEIELPGGIIVNAPDAEQSDAFIVSYPDKEAEAEQGVVGGEPVNEQSEKAAAASAAAPAAHGAEATGSDTGDAGGIGILAITAAGALMLCAAALLVSKKRKENE